MIFPCEQRKRKKLPPYGKSLAERQKFQNLPLFTVVCIGMDAWPRAKKWKNSPEDVEVMVIDGESPERFYWPVANYRCVVEWHTGPTEQIVIKLPNVFFALAPHQ